jgi:8-oxo-dGTP diphosphatase
MIQRAAIIVIREGKILLMHRKRNDSEYYVIPGGHIEEGESPEVTAKRELREETDIEAGIDFLFLENEDGGWHNYFYMAKNATGEARFGGEEFERNNEQNHYELEWIELSKLPEINLLPIQVKEKIIEKC